MSFIKKYKDKRWYWSEISCNPNITLEDIINNLELPWDWSAISANSVITMDDIERNPELPWDWSGISINPNLLPVTCAYYSHNKIYRKVTKITTDFENDIEYITNLSNDILHDIYDYI